MPDDERTAPAADQQAPETAAADVPSQTAVAAPVADDAEPHPAPAAPEQAPLEPKAAAPAPKPPSECEARMPTLVEQAAYLAQAIDSSRAAGNERGDHLAVARDLVGRALEILRHREALAPTAA